MSTHNMQTAAKKVKQKGTQNTTARIFDAPCTLFNGATKTKPAGTYPISEILTRIATGTYKKQLTRLTQTLAEKGKDAYTEQKNRTHLRKG